MATRFISSDEICNHNFDKNYCQHISSNNLQTTADPSIADIEIWEEEVNNTATFTPTENKLLLATSSVARHSLKYWHSVSNNPHHAWRYDMSCSGSSMKIGNRLLVAEEWQTIGYADAAGALKGGLYAAFTGGGVLAGAAAGGAAYSITAAITVYWDDISAGASKVLDWLCLWCD